MAARVLITGHTGRLGVPLVNALSETFDVVGVSRKKLKGLNASQISCDLKRTPDDLVANARDDGPIFEHAVLAANLCPWKELGELTNEDIATALSVGVTSVLKVAQQLEADWKACTRDAKYDRSITIVSSIAGAKVFGTKQVLYGTVKAAQFALAEQLAGALAPLNVRVNVLLPNSFPSIIKTEAVVSSIVRLINGRENRLKEYLL